MANLLQNKFTVTEIANIEIMDIEKLAVNFEKLVDLDWEFASPVRSMIFAELYRRLSRNGECTTEWVIDAVKGLIEYHVAEIRRSLLDLPLQKEFEEGRFEFEKRHGAIADMLMEFMEEIE
jgi:hypothetical protein